MQYQSGILGQAPNSSQNVKPNMVDPLQATIGGAMGGFGFANTYGPQMVDAFNNARYGQQQGPMQPGNSWGS